MTPPSPRKKKPPRLLWLYQSEPLFFVTFNTHGRRPLLANNPFHSAFLQYGERAIEHGVGVGRYVLMPDHVHLFVRFGAGSQTTLSAWTKGLKRHLDRCLVSLGKEPLGFTGQKLCSFWQPGFFDHVLRSDESYACKWKYVRQNPVRAGLVTKAADWPYAGEIVNIDRA